MGWQGVCLRSDAKDSDCDRFSTLLVTRRLILFSVGEKPPDRLVLYALMSAHSRDGDSNLVRVQFTRMAESSPSFCRLVGITSLIAVSFPLILRFLLISLWQLWTMPRNCTIQFLFFS